MSSQTVGRPPVRVLVVDDSVAQRAVLIALINADPELAVIGWAANGADAVQATALLKPDVIAMDLNMPVMDGLEATRQILQETPTPIVLVTAGSRSVAGAEKRLAFDALDAGVLALLSKPGIGPDGHAATQELHRTLKNMAQVRMVRRWGGDRLRPASAGSRPAPHAPPGAQLEVVAIGASTGGPPVLRTILVGLPRGFGPPVLIVQHIADDFAVSLVDWLRPQCGLPIQIAADGEPLNRPGIWIAPPGRHMGVRGRAIALVDGPPISLHRPSATHLFQSVAREYGRAAVGVLLTGMGDDGAVGLGNLKRAGATTIAQDETTSVVFSMPQSAIRLGVVDHVVPPPAIAPILLQKVCAVTMDPLAFIADFRAEVIDHLSALDEQLLRLERDPADTQAVRAMFLAAHSIKGGAAMLGLSELSELSHALEDVLGVLRDEKRPLEHATADVLFRAVDQLRALVVNVDGIPHPSAPETLVIVAELAVCTTTLTPPTTAIVGERRVLLVEDSPSVRQVETFLLQDAGFVVDAAESGNEALERAHRVRYALVIAGVETRELRGPDLVLALRAGAADPPVPVLLTMTDHGPSSPASSPDIVFAPKGTLGNADFVRLVLELIAQAAAA